VFAVTFFLFALRLSFEDQMQAIRPATASATRPQATPAVPAPGRRAALAGLVALVPALTVAAPGEFFFVFFSFG
jgi:hypothetical protein